ncbi:MAG TPA: hypothetical protein VFE60_17095 [Roseiarcus sp.]|nr:hypothetical protein [Roseiarcus sp.]
MGDDAHAFEHVENVGAGAVQINDKDTVAAGVNLQESDAGAPWIETGGLGVLDRGYQLLSFGDQGGDLAGRRLELPEGPLPKAISLAFASPATFST